ncbi:MAG: hypothetical protein GXP54_08070 [Deltaproteobacteria bacterium]|nr:hypothetical protein [Deltaproteobacteria bacterium]
MRREYFCPHCGATLNPNIKIILLISNGDQKGLVLASPQPGDYELIVPRELTLKNGDLVTIECAVCGADLKSNVDEKLAKVGFRDSTGEGGHVDFSRVFGEHATYFVTRESVQSYGEHADVYHGRNFFGEGRLTYF